MGEQPDRPDVFALFVSKCVGESIFGRKRAAGWVDQGAPYISVRGGRLMFFRYPWSEFLFQDGRIAQGLIVRATGLENYREYVAAAQPPKAPSWLARLMLSTSNEIVAEMHRACLYMLEQEELERGVRPAYLQEY